MHFHSRKRKGVSGGVYTVTVLAFIVLLALLAYTMQGQIGALQNQSNSIQQELSSLQAGNTSYEQLIKSLPIMNQTPTVRTVRETWYLSPSAHQDRFDPAFIIVNQGDIIHLTLIDNDTVAHTFTIGPPYNINVNATVPGLINDLTGQTFTTPATDNSPGVVVRGTPGNVSATYSFVAKYAGIYEFVCVYHASIGMVGYLVVLPNLAYKEIQPAGSTTTGISSVKISIVPGAGSNTSLKGYSPDTITVVIGVNNTVTWINNDSAPHTVTANDGSFDSGNISPGGTFTFTFTRPGVYQYHCFYHPWMTGTVVVKQG